MVQVEDALRQSKGSSSGKSKSGKTPASTSISGVSAVDNSSEDLFDQIRKSGPPATLNKGSFNRSANPSLKEERPKDKKDNCIIID